jgi:hypothetical protein
VPVPIAAEVVEIGEEDMEANIRKKLMLEAATADIVSTKIRIFSSKKARDSNENMCTCWLFWPFY